MANKRVRTNPRYLQFSAMAGGQSYTVTGDGVVVDEALVATLVAAGTAIGVGTTVADSPAVVTPPTSPLTPEQLASVAATLSATFAAELESTKAALLASPSTLLAGIGDSTMRGGTDTPGVGGASGTHVDGAWPQMACALLGQRLTFGRNAGVTGNTLAQMHARYAGDVASVQPDVVPILGGRNDVQYDWTDLATMKTRYQQLVADVRATNNRSGGKAVPIICTCLPTDDLTHRARLVEFNAWLRTYARAQGIFLVDFALVATDPNTGTFRVEFGATDGTHPGYAGHMILARYFADQVRPFLNGRAPRTAYDGEGAANLWPGDPLFTGPTTAGLSQAWGIVRTTSGTTFSTVRDPAVPGNMQRMAVTYSGPGGSTASENTIQTGRGNGSDLHVGDDISVSGYITKRGQVLDLTAFLGFGGGNPFRTVFHAQPGQEVTAARFYYRTTIPAASDQFQCYLSAQGGPGYADFGGFSLYNHTTGAYIL